MDMELQKQLDLDVGLSQNMMQQCKGLWRGAALPAQMTLQQVLLLVDCVCSADAVSLADLPCPHRFQLATCSSAVTFTLLPRHYSVHSVLTARERTNTQRDNAPLIAPTLRSQLHCLMSFQLLLPRLASRRVACKRLRQLRTPRKSCDEVAPDSCHVKGCFELIHLFYKKHRCVSCSTRPLR